MDFKHPERCQRQRTGPEGPPSKFYEISDNLRLSLNDLTRLGTIDSSTSRSPGLPRPPRGRPDDFAARHNVQVQSTGDTRCLRSLGHAIARSARRNGTGHPPVPAVHRRY
jgi:hypothetical protein